MSFKVQCVYWVVHIFSSIAMGIVDCMFWIKYKSTKRVSVSKVKEDLLLIPATTLAKKILGRELRAEDVMSAYITRAKEVQPIINIIVGEQYSQALQAAIDLDKALDSLTKDEREAHFSQKVLLGVPLSVKECFAWEGMIQSSGVPGRRHLRATHTSPCVANLMAAGAIPFIQTNTSEACMWYESSNTIYGTTCNAYDTRCIVGGSSGGEGSAISAGASVIGVGSDIGGSIRMPCFFNGIFGHKPTPGLVDNTGQWPIATAKNMDMLATGPMCRYAEDLAVMLRVMAGEGPAQGLAHLDTQVDLSKLTVISVPDDGGSIEVSKVDPELKQAQHKVAQHLQSLGASVTETHINEFRESIAMWAGRMNMADDGPPFSEVMTGMVPPSPPSAPRRVPCLMELGRWLLGASGHTFPAILLGLVQDYTRPLTRSTDRASVAKLQVLREKLLVRLRGDTVLLYPSHPTVAPYHNRPIFTPFNFAYTGLFNALGFPVTQVPLGIHSKKGVPLGVQVVAAPGGDHLTLAVARELQAKFGGWVNPGGLSEAPSNEEGSLSYLKNGAAESSKDK